MKQIYLIFVLLLASTKTYSKSVEELYINKISSFSIDSSINPATYNYFEEGFKKAKSSNSDLILIKLNTPGGLVSTTKKIITLIGNTDLPIVIWITPEGASATSAGAIMASAAHIITMSRGTNIGAATPINLGQDIKKSDIRTKAINDLVSLVRSLGQSRGRNSSKFAEMITEGKSFTTNEALQLKIIDFVSNSEIELLDNIRNKYIIVKGKKKILKLDKPEISYVKMDIGQSLLNILADPSLSYILFLVGAALIYLELQAAGGFIAGSTGITFLILAGIGMQILPVNFGSLGLVLLSFFLFILEIFVTSYGILSLAGVISLILGSLFLYRTEDSLIQLSLPLIASAVLAIISFIGIVGYVIARDHKNIGKVKGNDLTNLEGVIVSDSLENFEDYHSYQIKVSGEIWQAISKEKLMRGQHITVIKKHNKTFHLEIKSVKQEN